MFLLAALAASTMLTITVDGVAQPPSVLPITKVQCDEKALNIMLKALRSGSSVLADCEVLVEEEPKKASEPTPPKKE